MVNSGKSSLLSTITAVVCIILYAAALVYGAARIVSSSKDRSIAAESEFNDITDRASSAAVLGFMSTPYQNAILDSITESRTILGVIITGSNGEYGFERQPGTVIIWTGNSARFKTGFGISGTPFYKSVWIEGQRNATVQAVYSYLDYDLLIQVLKETLIFIFIVMALAIFVLLLDMNLKSLKGKAEISDPSSLDDEESADKESGDDEESADDEQSAQSDLPEDDFAEYESDSDNEPVAEEPDLPEPQTAKQQKVEPQTAEAQTAKPQTAAAKKEEYPKGLFSPRGIGWESYTKER
ncbi:MAG: DNA polymerase V family protein, partial [Treponema sp.]|nr:DNA polymerase V family protein [Treponema sp.]